MWWETKRASTLFDRWQKHLPYYLLFFLLISKSHMYNALLLHTCTSKPLQTFFTMFNVFRIKRCFKNLKYVLREHENLNICLTGAHLKEAKEQGKAWIITCCQSLVFDTERKPLDWPELVWSWHSWVRRCHPWKLYAKWEMYSERLRQVEIHRLGESAMLGNSAEMFVGFGRVQ